MSILPPPLVKSVPPRSATHREILKHFALIGLFLTAGIVAGALVAQCGDCGPRKSVPIGISVAFEKVEK